MLGNIKLHITHIAGSRMIVSVIDGLSRGSLTEGFIGHFLSQGLVGCVPLHLSPLQQSPTLLQWLRTWIPFCSIEPLAPEEWFTQGHGLAVTGVISPSSNWHPQLSKHSWLLWDLAPAAAPSVLRSLVPPV